MGRYTTRGTILGRPEASLTQRIWLGPLALGLVCLAVGLLSARMPAPPEVQTVNGPVAPCVTDTNSFKPLMASPGPSRWQGTSGELWETSLVEQVVCSPGVLELSVQGNRVAGWAPLVVVTLDEEVLNEREVPSSAQYDVNVPRAGLLRVAYLNDRYERTLRGVRVERITLAGGAACIKTPPWTPQVSSGVADWTGEAGALYGQVKLVSASCGRGTLELEVTGLHSDPTLPTLLVRHAEQVLGRFEVGAKRRIALDVPDRGPLTIELINGYFKELGDRNLRVYSLAFRPRPVR